MSLFKKSEPLPHQWRAKAQVRFSRISKAEVMDWVDNAMAGAWKAMEEYRKAPSLDQLDEAERGLQMVLGAVDDLRNREKAV